jgi:hypothetical protein
MGKQDKAKKENQAKLGVKYEQQEKAKRDAERYRLEQFARDAGRYSLEEAAEELAQHTGERASTMQDALESATFDRVLKVYKPGETVRYEYPDAPDSNVSGPVGHRGEAIHAKLFGILDTRWSEEAYWDDLNAWLIAHEPRITWRFRAPTAKVKTGYGINASGDDSQKLEDPQPIANWKMRIQEQAAILWRQFKKSKCSPTKNSIKGDLAKWCRENNVTTGKSGIFPSETYIYRHVLRGWMPPSG